MLRMREQPIIPAINRLLPDDTGWLRTEVTDIDQLADAVIGAGLDAVQMSRGQCRGSLAFCVKDGVTLSSGRIFGTVSLRGALSEKRITVGVVLSARPGSWHWMQEVSAGSVGVFRAGDLHDAFYGPGSCYLAATLTLDELEAQAAQEELVLNDRILGGSRLHRQPMMGTSLRSLGGAAFKVHEGTATKSQGQMIARQLVSTLARHFARPPRHNPTQRRPDRHVDFASRARAYIHDNLHDPINIDDLVAASRTSRRTLFRAFIAVFGVPPQIYVRRLRLHRIRQDLAGEREARTSIALVAAEWGIDQPGRLAGWYREVFGELPSQTIARRNC